MRSPESHERTRELVSGERGRMQSGPGGSHTAFERRSDPHEIAAERFAARIADELARGLDERAVERIILCAPPRFLGALRAALPDRVRRAVVATVDKDWTGLPSREIPDRLRSDVPDDAGAPADHP